MKKMNKIFLYASVLILTSGIAAVPTVAKAGINLDYNDIAKKLRRGLLSIRKPCANNKLKG